MSAFEFFSLCGAGAFGLIALWVWALVKTKNYRRSGDKPEDWL